MQRALPAALHYDRPTIWFHWMMAVLVLLQWGLYQFPEMMTRVGDSRKAANLIRYGERGDSPCQFRSDPISMHCNCA